MVPTLRKSAKDGAASLFRAEQVFVSELAI